MRRHTNGIVYGIAFILSGCLVYYSIAFIYPLLTFIELFKYHPVSAGIIPFGLIILGIILLLSEFIKRRK